MKKILSLVLAALMLLGCCSFAAAEVPEGYPAIIEGLDFGGATVYIYDWWSNDDENHSARTAEPDEETQHNRYPDAPAGPDGRCRPAGQ